MAPPFKTVEFDIMYGVGISKVGELLDLGATSGVIEKSGSWYSYNDQRIGQGRENAKQFLIDHPDIATAVENTIRSQSSLTEASTTEPDITETSKKEVAAKA